MATNKKCLEIPNRLKSIKGGSDPDMAHIVAGADDIYDDAKEKKQSVINADVDNAIGSDSTVGSIKGRIKAVENSVDTLNGDASTSGSVAQAIANATSDIIDDAGSDYNTLGKLEDKIQELDTAKANKATTLAGYGITDAYTKSETYSKTEIHDYINTPNQGYVTAVADQNTTTLNLKALIDTAAGSDKEKAQVIYRVGCWDGSIYDVTMYSEYAWIGNDYVFLCKKSQIDEVFDITVYKANTKYATLADALAAIANDSALQSIRRGGMSVKFVQSSDNKYVQYRLILSTFTDTQFANKDNWQIIDESGVFDISVYNAISGVPAQYNSLQDAINAIPSVKRIAGMSIRYIDNDIYKQYRHTAKTKTNTWYSDCFVSDVVLANNAENLIRPITLLHLNISNLSGMYCSNTQTGLLSPAIETRDSYIIPVLEGAKYKITCPSRVSYSKEPFYFIEDGTKRTFIASVTWSSTALEVPSGANALILTIDPTAQDTSCVVELVDSIDGKVLKDSSIEQSKLDSALSNKVSQIDELVSNEIYDVSEKYPTSGIDGSNKYNLQLAISTIPSADRKGGMIIKFIDNTTNEYDVWFFKAKTKINQWFVHNFINYRELDNDVFEALVAYSSSIDLIGKYYGIYCSNTGTGAQADATATRDSYMLRVVQGQKYKVTCPSKVYGKYVQLYSKAPFDSDTLIESLTPSSGVFTVPSGANYLSITVDPTAQDKSCVIKALEIISEDKLDTQLKEKINNPTVQFNKGFLYGKTLVTLCDSMGDNRAWQQRIVDLTGANWSLLLNNDHYSRGGTKTLYAPQQSNDGQGRAKRLYDDFQNGIINPDVIIYQNVNDNSGLQTGESTDEPFFRTLQELVSVGNVPSSLADAETYWQNNLSSIVGNYTPNNGVILGVPYTSSNGVKVKITGTPTQDGTLVFRLGSTGYGFTLTLKTTDSISDIIRKILEYDYLGYIDVEDPNDSNAVIFTNMDGVTVGTFNVISNSAGITYETTSGVSGQLALWKYFKGHDLTKWTNGDYWVDRITRWAMWKGVIEYLQTHFPSAMIYWMLPRTYNFDYDNLPSEALFPDGTVNYSYIYEHYDLYDTILDLEKQFCEMYKIPVLDLPADCGINPMNASYFCNIGDVHPKQEADYRWAEIIVQQIN